MIVSNNLCHLYRMGNDNSTEYQHCLQRLLSSIMVVVDRNKIATDTTNNNYYNSSNNYNYNNEDCDENDNNSDEVSTVGDNEEGSSVSLSWSRSWFASTTSASSSTRRSRQRHSNTTTTAVDLDGFLQSVSPLILREQQCAAIA
mmetsp:Transcript_50113/g.50978  ORF Transcript_50113/g.50978 Transcript_50113/m.50978 type:complete len:144 (+) Transcript_50113:252-683(+)